jgi:DNA-binding response OmpR family regulator
MPMISLQGCSILVVDDEPLIALDVADALQKAGAEVETTHTIRNAVALAENKRFSAAILDQAFGDGDSSALREKLGELGVPFLIYSGLEDRGNCNSVIQISKPATSAMLLSAVESLLNGR